MGKWLIIFSAAWLVGGQMADGKSLQKATFAGGCFWCMEKPFDQIPGVIETLSGYCGGTEENPSYEQVSNGKTGHRESIQITYDPAQVTYARLAAVFWRQIDPTDAEGQFVDRGKQYKSAIFYHSDEQKEIALKTKAELQQSGRFKKQIATEILPAAPFYKAEAYHQDYYKKNPIRYQWYRLNSGRDAFLKKAWGETPMTKEELKKKLTPLQYEITQNNGTEPPFKNEFWDNKKAGIYVDVVSGEPLFSSLDKFDSGTGWPSFTQPLVKENIITKKDFKLILPRTEVRSKKGNSHLGHVFSDGPAPTGLRYCINSAALRFIPAEKLKTEGYGQFESLFNR